MANPRAGWEEVGARLSELGLKLKLHFEQAAKEGRPEEEDKVKESLRMVGDAVDRTFTALGGAARDDAVRDDVRDVGRSMLSALDATFSELGDRFRATVKHEAPASESVEPAAAPDAPASEPEAAPDAPESEPEAKPDAPESEPDAKA
ncbi:hypothetical protein BH24ACT7_BH24ACT7_13320 [soil metagenome]